MADETIDEKAGQLTPRDPSLEDVVELCRQLKDRGDLYFLEQLFANQGISPPDA